MVLFAFELIPAMGAPTASVDLLHKAREQAADAHTPANSIWYIFIIPRRTPFTATNAIPLQLFHVVPVEDSATQCRTCGGFRYAATKISAGAPIAGIHSQAKRTMAKLKNL
jgi:hypothetical protein